MEFPISHCIPTSLLTTELYSNLICHLVSDGYINNISNIQLISLVQLWDYLGVDENECIVLYDKPLSYMRINQWMDHIQLQDNQYPNILTKEWLEGYLNGK